jgi:hypothetical protein
MSDTIALPMQVERLPLAGAPGHRRTGPCVVIQTSGDLTHRKLIPRCFTCRPTGSPEDSAVLG